jgi:hypothetical protein
MALTELQLPTKSNFYAKLQNAATQMDNLITHWRNLAEFIGMIEVADLDAMGVASGQVRTDLNHFRTVLNEIITFYDGEPVTPTNPPNEVIDKIRMM